ncbi:MAG: ABC transporter permease [Candidatus Kerfeldbacteria bacterium]|nr:ABC transporter permease [Candidatus Kerfeldbacteria bacterium]
MSAVSRGTKNVFRNPIRTFAVVIILGLSLGTVVVMLAAQAVVDQRISEVKSNIGNTITVSPAGARGFLGGGEPLKPEQAETVKALANITSVDATIDAQMVPNTDTTLQSPIEAGTLGGRGGRIFNIQIEREGRQVLPENFQPPILAIGTNNAHYGGELVGRQFTFSSGTAIDASSESMTAHVGKTLAEKNALTPGSTFTAFGETITVSGIFDAGNQFANNATIFPLKTLQKLSDQEDSITSLVAHVNTVSNIATATNAVKAALGDTADVTNSEDSVRQAIAPLENIRTIATTSLVGALIAAAVITLLTMVMIVRERRKEIAVLKALGAGDRTIISQFVSEAVLFSVMGGLVGTILGFAFANPVVRALATSSQRGPQIGPETVGGGPGGAIRTVVGGFRAVQGAVRDLQTVVDWQIVLYGFIAAIGIAIIGSAVPAWLISKIRPAEVLRNE